MAKQKDIRVTLTHTEILTYAIRSAYNDWQAFNDRLTKAKEVNPELAEEMERIDYTRPKLEALYALYEMETGTSYGLD